MRHNWTYKKLGEVGNVITGSTPATKDERNYSSADFCFFKPSDLSAEKFSELNNSEFHVSSYAYEHSRKLPKDTILTTCIGIIGKVGILTVDAICNQQINAIIPNREIVIPRFLGYAIMSQKQMLTERANAPVVPLLNKSQFSNIIISVPSLDEQKSIVQELDGINHLIDLQEQQLREYDNLAQSLFFSTFGDPLTNPQGWDMKKLGEVAEIVGGSTPKTSEEKNWIGTNNWISPAEIKDDDKYISSTERCISDDAASHLQLLPIGTVLLSSRAPIGKLAITRIPMYCNQGFKNIVCGKTLNNEYAYWYMKFNVGRLQEMGVGATFKEVSKTIVSAFPIMLPPIELQQSFAAQIEAIEQQKALIRKSLDETRTLLAARMQYYFE